jgi:SAM-dependent methyltransferase
MHSSATFQGTIRLAPFNPTCTQAQEIALKLLSLSENDVLFDLGCGDGRLLVAAASQNPGLRCVGIEIDPVHAKRASESVLAAAVASRVEIREGDAMKLMNGVQHQDTGGLSLQHDATSVFLYLLPKGLETIKPFLEAAADQRRQTNKPFRIVSYMFRIPGWHESTLDRTTKEKGDCPLYLYNLNSNNEP